MKSATGFRARSLVLAAVLFSSVAFAAPARRAIQARKYVTDVETVTVWTTVDVTTTVYVDEDAPASPTAAAVTAAESREAIVNPPAPETSVPSPAPTPEEPAPTPAAPSPPASSAGPGEFAETPAYVPPPAPSAPSPAPAPAPAPVVEEPAPSPVEEPAPAAPAVGDEPVASSGGSDSADCKGPGSSCKGEVTHWDGGLGACGTVVDTKAENAVALPVGYMGALSNSNPLCGKTIHVKGPSGTVVTGIVKDKCMGCEGRAIDLTDKMFAAATDGKGDGREAGFEWWLD